MNYGQNIRYGTIANVAVQQFRGMTVAGSFSTNGLNFHGVCIDKPTAGDHVGLICSGETKLQISSGGLAVDDQVTITTSGFGTKCNSGYWSIGRCVFTANSGGFANVYLYGGPSFIGA